MQNSGSRRYRLSMNPLCRTMSGPWYLGPPMLKLLRLVRYFESRTMVATKPASAPRGFTQRWGEDYDETFAPVAKYNSVRTLFALMAGRKGVKVHQMDVNTAFLYSPLSEEVYIEQPEGLEISGKKNWVCKLNRTLYDLKQSP